jgi:hypothetical protein
MSRLTARGLWLALALTPVQALAQVPPDPKGIVGKSVARPPAGRLCQADGRVGLRQLIGELGMNAGLNVLALPPAPPLASGPIAPTPESTMASWIIATDSISPDEALTLKLRADELEKLSAIRYDLVEYLRILASAPGETVYVLAPGSTLGAEPENRRADVLESLFAPLLGGNRIARVGLDCTPLAVKAPEPADPTSPPGTPRFAVRGKIDDLAVPRFKIGSNTDVTDAFGKASEAKVSYTDNDIKQSEAIAAELAVGYGWQLTQYDALIGFVHYVESTTETGAVGDDDDSKDLRALSPGVLYRVSVGGPESWLYGSAGATVYPTYDLAQDARLVRARLFLNDIAIRRDGPPVCGAEALLADRVLFDCRLGVFAEFGHILEAGTSTDLAIPEDDDYTGIGATFGVSFSPAQPAWLAPFSFTANYRYLHVLDGVLDEDPERFSIELAYRIPKSNLSLGLSCARGENSETFQYEDLVNLSIGYKY